MRLAPAIPALRRWRLWVGAIIVAEVCWFALMRPRLAGNFHAILMLALDPLAVVGYVYLMAAVSAYLAEREWDFRLRQMIVIMLGLSAGCFVFALLWLAKVHFEGVLGRIGSVERANKPAWFWFRVALYLGLGTLALCYVWQ